MNCKNKKCQHCKSKSAKSHLCSYIIVLGIADFVCDIADVLMTAVTIMTLLRLMYWWSSAKLAIFETIHLICNECTTAESVSGRLLLFSCGGLAIQSSTCMIICTCFCFPTVHQIEFILKLCQVSPGVIRKSFSASKTFSSCNAHFLCCVSRQITRRHKRMQGFESSEHQCDRSELWCSDGAKIKSFASTCRLR